MINNNISWKYWVERKLMKSFVWYHYLSFLRVYIGLLCTKRKLIKKRKKCARTWGAIITQIFLSQRRSTNRDLKMVLYFCEIMQFLRVKHTSISVICCWRYFCIPISTQVLNFSIKIFFLIFRDASKKRFFYFSGK